MLFAEAAAVIGIDEMPRTYNSNEVAAVTEALKALESPERGFSENTSVYSPITLNSNWPWLWRLFFLMFFTGIGCIFNAFFIATIFTFQELKKKGNVFLACLGLADLIITGLVVPTAIAVMLSNISDTLMICQILQLMTQWASYIYSLFYMFVAIDIYIRLVCGFICYRKCLKYPFSVVVVLNFGVSLVTAWAGVFYDLDYDYCSRSHYGNYLFRGITSIVFYVIPGIVTFSLLFHTSLVMKDRVTRLIRFKRLPQFEKDKSLTNLHLSCFLFFVIAWIPYLVLVNLYPDAEDAKYYSLIWLGLLRCTFTSILYGALNNTFRVAFRNLFIYFCCKGPLAQPNSGRRRKFYEMTPNGIRVVRNANSPRRDPPPVMYVM